MAKIPGGITSRPSGKLGNIIFGAARTPEGKVATAREAVDPSNPNTPEQQAQRGKFRQALNIVQGWGPGIYQDDWNRAVGQLPGFQSVQSVMLNNIDSNNDLVKPPTRPLGDLYIEPGDPQTSSGAVGEIDVDWTSTLGPNGTTNDTAVVIATEVSQPSGSRTRDVAVNTSADRSAAFVGLSGLEPLTDYLVALYFRGQGSADGLLSPVQWAIGTSG